MKGRTQALLGLAVVATLGVSAQAAFVETFNSATVGNNIGQVTGWFGTVGGGWATVNNSGVNGTNGLSSGDQGFNWTAQTFNWSTMATGDKVTMGMDYQASSTGTFDDDRMGWATNATTSTSSSNHFGVQLDNTGGNQVGVVGYWKISGTTIYKPIVSFSTAGLTPVANGWYQARATFTKLANGFASIDCTVQALDALGDPTGPLYTGSLADSSAYVAAEASPASYFAGVASPMYKNFSSAGGSVDNAYFSGVVAVPEPATLAVVVLGGLLLVRRPH